MKAKNNVRLVLNKQRFLATKHDQIDIYIYTINKKDKDDMLKIPAVENN